MLTLELIQINSETKEIIQEFVKRLEVLKQVNLTPMKKLAKNIEVMGQVNLASIQKLANSFEVMEQVNSPSMQELAKRLEVMEKVNLTPMQKLAKSLETTRRVNLASMQKLVNNLQIMNAYSISIQEALNEIPEFINLYNESIDSYNDLENENIQPVNSNAVVQYVNEVDNILQDNSLSVMERFCNVLVKLYDIYENIERYFSEHPIMFFIITTFILPIMINQVDEFSRNAQTSFISISQSTTENYSMNTKLLSKNIKKDISKELNNNKEADKKYLLNTYRFVNCDSLNMRVSNSIKSKSIYNLNRGSIVKIIKKQKNWTKVEYKNEDETVVIIGWVFTRYISRFN